MVFRWSEKKYHLLQHSSFPTCVLLAIGLEAKDMFNWIPYDCTIGNFAKLWIFVCRELSQAASVVVRKGHNVVHIIDRPFLHARLGLQ